MKTISTIFMAKFEYSKNKERKSSSKDKYSKRGSETGRSYEEFAKARKENPRRAGRSNRGSSRESSHGSRNRRDFTMTKVICSSCNKNCEVPFKPTNNKPIYCSDCFEKTDKPSSGRNSSKDLSIINDKLDKIMLALKIE